MSQLTCIKWFRRSLFEVAMPDKQLAYGQFETPVDVADLLLGFCLRRPEDRLLDPSCGNGAILARAAQMQRWLDPDQSSNARLWGVELDPEAAAHAQEIVPEAHIIGRNFFEMQPRPDGLFDAIVGNPPYTRAEWISWIEKDQRIRRQFAQQLSMFDDADGIVPYRSKGRSENQTLSRRAGLHAYFFLHGTQFLREGGRFGFVVPNSWLDVAYGERLKQFLLEHFKIIALIESSVERWFSQARINTCLVILEKCSDADRRAANQVKMVRVRRPLRNLFPYKEDDSRRLPFLESLIEPIVSEDSFEDEAITTRGVTQQGLAPAEKWGYILRAPTVLLQRAQAVELHPFKSWATVRRGYTTGANAFFYLNLETIDEWEIEDLYRRPLLKSFRNTNSRKVSAGDCDLELLSVGPDDRLKGTAVGEYIKWGEDQDFHRRTTCRGRQPWYYLPQRVEAPLLMAKGIWERHFAPVVDGKLAVDQQIYQIYLADGIALNAAAALLNSAWFELQLELHGRVNFGEGVLWLATYEIESLLLPDPRYIPSVQADELVSAFEVLLARPVGSVYDEARQADWQALNAVVFDILDLSPMEGVAITEALLDRLTVRKTKAGASH
jgi:methylase of polypeptide subunit release factors